MLEIKNLHVAIKGKPILDGLNLTVPRRARSQAIMGPNGSGKSTLSYVHRRHATDYEVTAGEVAARRREPARRSRPTSAPRKGVFLAFQYPIEIPGVATMTFLKAALNAQRARARRGGTDDARLHERGARRGAEPDDRSGDAASARSTSAFPAARRSAWRSCRWRCCAPRLGVLDETDSGLDIDALRIVADGVNALRDPERSLPGHHPLPAAARLHHAGRGACAWRRAASSGPAGRSWRWSWSATAIATTPARRREPA